MIPSMNLTLCKNTRQKCVKQGNTVSYTNTNVDTYLKWILIVIPKGYRCVNDTHKNAHLNTCRYTLWSIQTHGDTCTHKYVHV